MRNLGEFQRSVDGDVADDEAIEGLQVLIDAGKVLGTALADGAGKAGQRRVDEDEIGLVEQAVLIGDDLKRSGTGGLRAVGHHAHRADRAHVQPDGCGAGAAVVEEGDGTGFRVGAVFGVGDVEDAAVGLVVVITDEQRAGGRRVVDELTVQVQIVLGGGETFRRNGLVGLVGIGGMLVVRFLLVLRMGEGQDGQHGRPQQKRQRFLRELAQHSLPSAALTAASDEEHCIQSFPVA